MARRLEELRCEELLPRRNEAATPVLEIVDTLPTRDVHHFVQPDLSCADGITRSSRNQVFDYIEGALTPEVDEVDRTAVGIVVPQVGVVDLCDMELKEDCDRGLMRANMDLMPYMGYKCISHVQLHQNEIRGTRATSPKGFGGFKISEDVNIMESGTNSSKIGTAFTEELSLVKSAKYKSLQKKIRSPMHKKVPPSTSCQGAQSSSISSQPQRKSSRLSSKRRRIMNFDLLDWDYEEVQDVVLLDDEHAKDGSSDEWKEVKLYYPSRNHPESVALLYSDMKCLNPKQYLSSPIMNFYIQYLRNIKTSTGTPRGEYYIFNTFFYGKLEKALTQKGDRSHCFLKLRRWWKGVNIFSKAYVLLPIHGSSHWSLVIICNPGKEDDSGLLILHLDSLGLHTRQQISRFISDFLKEEWNYMKQNPTANLPFREHVWQYLPFMIERRRVTVPQQKNEYDCGIFVLYFIERFLEEAPQRMRKHDLSMFHSKWFKPAEASSLRKKILDLLVEEFLKSQSPGVESP